MQRLFPHPGPAATDAYDDLQLGDQAPAGRPYVCVNMVSTIDGQARIGPDTSELGNATDLALFLALRNQVDCVMAGTGTIAAERYKGPAAGEASQARRQSQGLRPRPLFATITRSGRIDKSIPLFADDGLEAVVCSDAEGLDFSDCAATVHVEPVTSAADVLHTLSTRYGVRSLLLEGGPTLNGPFFAAELVDELFFTLAPAVSGDAEDFPIVQAELAAVQRMHLIGALLDEDYLFLRYRVE